MVKVITSIKVIVCTVVQVVVIIIIVIVRAAVDIARRVRYWEGLLGVCWHTSFLWQVFGSEIIVMGILSMDRVGWQLALARCNCQAG